MNLLRKLWADDVGAILSAEAIVLGTVTVVGVTAGLSTVATSVNAELKDLAFGLRHLDQSYTIPGQTGCRACTAGSTFQQADIAGSLAQLEEFAEEAERSQKAQQERLQDQLRKQINSKRLRQRRLKRNVPGDVELPQTPAPQL